MRYARHIVAAGLALTVSAAASAQTPTIDKSYMGTWKLNVAKSKYENATPPKEATRIHEDRGSGFVLVLADNVNAQGTKSRSGYVYKPDGKEYPMAAANQPGYQTIALTAVDPLTVTYVIKVDGRVITNGRRTLSKDGRTMTLENTGTNQQGQKTHTVTVWDKQPSRSATN